MRELPINQAARSSRQCGWLALFLAVTASVFLFSPAEVQAQSQKGYWVKFTPNMSPFLLSGKMFESNKKNSCGANIEYWSHQVYVKPGDPIGRDAFGKDLSIMSEASLTQCRPTINEISRVSIDLRGNYFSPTLGTFKSVTFSDRDGERWYLVNIYNATIRVTTGGTNRGYRVLANISYNFYEKLSGQNPEPTISLGGFHINSYSIIEPTIGLRRLQVSEEQLRRDIQNGIHPPQSAVLGDLVGSLMTFNVRR